jgi:Transposase DDE domain
MPYKLKEPYRDKFKKSVYKPSNSRLYDESLKNRGSLTIWVSKDVISKWKGGFSKIRKRGGQLVYSDFSIETCITLSLVFRQRLCQTEGLVESIIKLLGLNLEVPDFTTISRRSKSIKVSVAEIRSEEGTVISIDSTGLKVYGEQEWQKEKYKLASTRKSWRKLHIAVDDYGTILGSELTLHDISDSATVPNLLNQISGPIDTVLGDGAYDQPSVYDAMIAHQEEFGNGLEIKAAIPPNLGFRPEMPTDSKLRVDNIRGFEKGRQRWQEHVDYGRRARAENVMFRYKAIIGNKLKSRLFSSQKTESKVAVNILNKMTGLGMPCSKKFA